MAERIIVVPEPARNQFEIHVDGKRAGLARYVDSGAQRIFVHTEVDDEFAGRGLAGQLVREALDATRVNGLRIVPVCPYVKKFVTEHHDWDDLLDPVTPDALRAAGA